MAMQTFAAFDLETTGFPGHGEIIQLAAVRFGPDGKVLDKLQMYVHPKSAVPVKITQLTGITDADVRWARPASEAVAIFKEFTAGDTLVGHNAVSFDGTFIADVDPTMKGRLIVDTLTASRLLLPNQSHKLTDLTAQFGIVQTNAHQAWSDAEATGDLLAHLVHVARQMDPAQLDALRKDPKAQNPSMDAFFNTIVPRTRMLPLNVPLETTPAPGPDAASAHRSDVDTSGQTPSVQLAGRTPDLMSFRIAGITLAGSAGRDSALGRTMRAIKLQPRVSAIARQRNGHRAVSAIYAQNRLRSRHPVVARQGVDLGHQALAG
jgi:DNA polymerase III epsilon subunit-like protein